MDSWRISVLIISELSEINIYTFPINTLYVTIDVIHIYIYIIIIIDFIYITHTYIYIHVYIDFNISGHTIHYHVWIGITHKDNIDGIFIDMYNHYSTIIGLL